MRLSRSLAFSVAFLVLAPLESQGQESAVDGYLQRGDVAWTGRSEGHSGSQAAMAPIAEAVRLYELALKADPNHLEARWKLLRALYFQGEYAALDKDSQLKIFVHAQKLAEQGIDIKSYW